MGVGVYYIGDVYTLHSQGDALGLPTQGECLIRLRALEQEDEAGRRY